MQRVLGVLVAVVLAAVVAFVFLRAGDPDALCIDAVERSIVERRFDEARRELAARSAGVRQATRDYCAGAIALCDGRDAEAEPLLAAAAELDPDDWRVVSALASVRANLGRRAAAGNLLGAYSARHPQDERALFTLAQVCLSGPAEEHDGKRALDLLDRIAATPVRTAMPPDRTAIPDTQIVALRVQAQSEAGHARTALIEARAAAERAPADPEAWFVAGEMARRAGQPDEAIAGLRKAYRLAPGVRRYGEQFVLTTFQYEDVGDSDEALEIAKTLLAAAPSDPTLKILYARAVGRAKSDPRGLDLADAVYIELLKENLPRDLLLTVLRNRSALLCDWKLGSREGQYLDDAYDLLKRYKDLGGDMEDKEIRTIWKVLQEHAAKRGR